MTTLDAASPYGPVTVLKSAHGGAYPYGNTVVVNGSEATLVIDPSLEVTSNTVGADAVMISHAHEDHIAGLKHFACPTHVHANDVEGVRSLAAMIDGFGQPAQQREAVEQHILDQFDLPPGRPDALAVEGDHSFDLGDLSATLIHLPGHTAGHCGVMIEPIGFCYVADIDLTSFGPMYGDLGSSLDDYLTSIETIRGVEARWYGTFHHKGVIDGAADFRRRLDDFAAVIHRRDDRLLEFLAEPRTLGDIVEHRLVYRPHVSMPFVDAVEKRTATLHLERHLRRHDVIEVEPGRFVRAGGRHVR